MHGSEWISKRIAFIWYSMERWKISRRNSYMQEFELANRLTRCHIEYEVEEGNREIRENTKTNKQVDWPDFISSMENVKGKQKLRCVYTYRRRCKVATMNERIGSSVDVASHVYTRQGTWKERKRKNVRRRVVEQANRLTRVHILHEVDTMKYVNEKKDSANRLTRVSTIYEVNTMK